jgi:hypothetical protein
MATSNSCSRAPFLTADILLEILTVVVSVGLSLDEHLSQTIYRQYMRIQDFKWLIFKGLKFYNLYLRQFVEVVKNLKECKVL